MSQLRRFLLLGITTLMVMGLVTPGVGADDGIAWDGPVRANFALFDNRNLPEADGYANFAYAKGKEAHNLHGQVSGMRADTYVLSVGVNDGDCDENIPLVTFTVDASGTAEFEVKGIESISADATFDIVRIYPQASFCHTELVAVHPPQSVDGEPSELLFRKANTP